MTENLRLWHVLIGAMLASKPVRDDAAGKIHLDDTPRELTDLWRVLTNGEREAVAQTFRAWGIDVEADGVIPSLARHLQTYCASEFCKKMISRASVTSLQTPEELRDKFVMLASRMESRIAELDKSREDARKAAEKAGA